MNDGPSAVLDFWFGPPPLTPRDAWFRKSDRFDADIRDRFGDHIEAAIEGTLPADWQHGEAILAQIILLDQFTRNIYRGTARAFAGDARALKLAQSMVAQGADQPLAPLQRWFVYLPFEHAEDPVQQDHSVALFTALAAEDPSLASALDYAERHREVISRFGRFPHRNASLGRQSSGDERVYLQTPGSGF